MSLALRVCTALTLLAPAMAAAEEVVDDEDVAARMEALESSERAILRAAELQMFGGERTAEAASGRSVVRIGAFARAVSSDANEERALPSVRARDLSWLNGLALPDIPVRWDDRVVRYLEFFRNDPRGRSLMSAWLARAAAYAPMIRSELRALGLPEDLLYVAMIESGFDVRARSAASAVGLWQFVSRTGSEYGLRIDPWVDERNDPRLATRAAARFLKDLHGKLRTWELSFAAYNMGYGALVRSLRKYNTNDYWVLSRTEAALPFETTLYVAKAMACAVVGRNAALFGFEEIAPFVEPAVANVEVPGGTTLASVAKAAGVELDVVSTLNPSLLKGRAPPAERAFVVRIPASKLEVFSKRFTRARSDAVATRTHVVQFGEAIEEIARRYRTTPAVLRKLNSLDASTPLRPGIRLLVPAVEPKVQEGSPPVVTVPSGIFRYEGRKRLIYRVEVGDTFQTIARYFGVSLDELRRWNAIDTGSGLVRGMYLQVFVRSDFEVESTNVFEERDVQLLALGSEAFFEHYERQQGRVRLRYVVTAGDTLATIGRRFGLKIADLTRINRFGASASLRPGQEIVVYAPQEKVPARLREGTAAVDTDRANDDPRWANLEP